MICAARGASKPFRKSGWHQPLFGVFSLKRNASKRCRTSVFGRVAVVHVQGFGLKTIAPFSFTSGFEHPATRDHLWWFFLLT
ncbi:MAG: hypothetical protein KAJ86_05855 [Alphaproteobacteria bacterium]|nr:hypothetical protein [Alphaproteobacteria bacterium]